MNKIKPTFLICGAQKSGTTTLQEWLSKHPDVFIPNPTQNKLLKTGRGRELQFFYDEGETGVSNWDKGISWYMDQFKEWNGEKEIGEKSPSYLYYEVCPKRIYDVLGKNTKLIISLRHPVDRAYSSYWMAYSEGFGSFEEKVYDSMWLKQGHYAKQIKRYLKFFDKENIFICTLKEIKDSPIITFNNICSFLDIDDHFIPDNIKKRYKVGREGDSRVKDVLRMKSGYKPMNEKIRKELIDYFLPYNEDLKEIYPELDIDHWNAERITESNWCKKCGRIMKIVGNEGWICEKCGTFIKNN